MNDPTKRTLVCGGKWIQLAGYFAALMIALSSIILLARCGTGAGTGTMGPNIHPGNNVATANPTVRNVFPDSCVSTGGCPVTITGNNFVSGMTVAFGGVAATSVTVSSPTQLIAIVPPGTAGQEVPVVIAVSSLKSTTWNGSFRYGRLFVSDNFSAGNFSKWSRVVGQPDLAGNHGGTPLAIVQGGQTTYDGTTTPTLPNGATREARIWYGFRQGTVSTNGTALTLVKGDPFNPHWKNYRNIAIGKTVGYGTVKVSGTSVTWVSGQKFPADGSWNGKRINFQGFGTYTISSVTSPTKLTLVSRARTIKATSYLAPAYTISSCSSTTACTLRRSAGTQTNVSYGSGSDDENIYFAYRFPSPYPDHVFVRGYVYFQAPTVNGPYGGRKLFYEKTGGAGCGGRGADCAAVIFSGEVYGNVAPKTVTNGTVNTSGTAVTWASGDQFVTDGSWTGTPICIAGNCQYTVASVIDATDLTLTNSAGTQTGVTYAAIANSIELNTGAVNTSGEYPPSKMNAPLANYNQWYEVETEAQLNTPGYANGYYKVWVNGQYRPDLSKSGLEIRLAGQTDGFKWIEIGRQLDAADIDNNRFVGENEYRYWSDVAIGDAFIGP